MVDEQSRSATTQSGNRYLRMLWIGAMPAILVCIFTIARTERWTFTGYDGALLGLVAVAISARAVDVQCFGGTTVYGEPASGRVVVLFAIGLVLVVGVAWVLAQSILV